MPSAAMREPTRLRLRPRLPRPSCLLRAPRAASVAERARGAGLGRYAPELREPGGPTEKQAADALGNAPSTATAPRSASRLPWSPPCRSWSPRSRGLLA
eukprot:13118490-Alexandrium_andersonii.AAC.1